MKSTVICLSLILSFHTLFVQGQNWVHLGTGNGVIQAQQTTTSSGVLIETNHFCPYCQNQWWTIEQDARFPTGSFIRSVAYPNLVWDSQKGISAAGNPIILYQQKNTAADTKNQRWLQNSANQFSLAANTNLVAKVIHSGSSASVALAKTNSSDLFQRFFQISPSEIAQVTVVNWLPRHVVTAFETVAGKIGGEQGNVGYTYRNIPIGSWAGIYDGGELIYNSTISSLEATIIIPRTDLPVGTQGWKLHGWSLNSGINDATLSLTWSSDTQILTGYGIDNYGNFTIQDGTYDLGGNVGFSRVYNTSFFFQGCYGSLGNTTTVLSGGCYDSDWIFYLFSYTLYN